MCVYVCVCVCVCVCVLLMSISAVCVHLQMLCVYDTHMCACVHLQMQCVYEYIMYVCVCLYACPHEFILSIQFGMFVCLGCVPSDMPIAFASIISQLSPLEQ